MRCVHAPLFTYRSIRVLLQVLVQELRKGDENAENRPLIGFIAQLGLSDMHYLLSYLFTEFVYAQSQADYCDKYSNKFNDSKFI